MRAIGLSGLFLSLATLAAAQQGGPFGGFKHDRSAPIEITSDSLEVHQEEELAIFQGDVIAGQGTMRLTSDRLDVYYDEDGDDSEASEDGTAAPAAQDEAAEDDSGTGAIRFMRAEGNVFLSNGTETAQGNWAEYDVESGMMFMGGDVILTQGKNAISGPSLTIDLNTGRGRVDGGRVTSIFTPKKKGEDEAGADAGGSN